MSWCVKSKKGYPYLDQASIKEITGSKLTRTSWKLSCFNLRNVTLKISSIFICLRAHTVTQAGNDLPYSLISTLFLLWCVYLYISKYQNDTSFYLACTCMLPEKGHNLGSYMHEHPRFTVNLKKRGDSAEVKELKKLLSKMLSRDPKARPLIQEVVTSLSSLWTALGAVQVFEVAVNTVWKQPKLHCKC